MLACIRPPTPPRTELEPLEHEHCEQTRLRDKPEASEVPGAAVPRVADPRSFTVLAASVVLHRRTKAGPNKVRPDEAPLAPRLLARTTPPSTSSLSSLPLPRPSTQTVPARARTITAPAPYGAGRARTLPGLALGTWPGVNCGCGLACPGLRIGQDTYIDVASAFRGLHHPRLDEGGSLMGLFGAKGRRGWHEEYRVQAGVNGCSPCGAGEREMRDSGGATETGWERASINDNWSSQTLPIPSPCRFQRRRRILDPLPSMAPLQQRTRPTDRCQAAEQRSQDPRH